MKTLAEFKLAADKAIRSIRENYIRLGKIVHEARETLSAGDLALLMLHLAKAGMARSDLDAAVAAFLYENPDASKGKPVRRINPLLIFAGAANAKVLNLSEADQARLLSGEKLDIVDSRGRVQQKTWAEMFDFERNLLIARDGRIRTKEEQLQRVGEGPPATKLLGTIEATEDMLRFKSEDGRVILTASVRAFLNILGQENWKKLRAMEPEEAVA